MKAMIWKELKENSKWAVLAALGLGLAYAYMLSQAFGRDQHYNPYQAYGLPMPTTTTAPFIGLLLGLLQIIPELRRDQWAFLMHRPVPRATLFWAKVLSGLSLYLLATGLPFLVAVLWMSTPGRMAAPFDWRLTLAGTVDILTGSVFYFAGILTALRPARWYGSRAFGIGAAVLCVLAAGTVANELWQALLIIAVGAGVLLMAARGSFLTTGEYDGQPKLAKVALGTTLFTGGGVVCCGAIALLFTMGSTLVPQSPTPYVWTHYEVDTKGRVVLVTHEDSVLKSMKDLNGKPILITRESNRKQYGAFLNKEDLDVSDRRHYVPSYRTPSRYYTVLQEAGGGMGDVTWFYDRDRGLVPGYSRLNKRLTGYMTPGGFLPAGVASTRGSIPRFHGPLLNIDRWDGNHRILAFRDAVYRINLSEQRIKRIATAPPAQPIDGAMEVDTSYNWNVFPGVIAVASNNQIRIYSAQNKFLLTLPWEYKPERHYYVQLSLSYERDRLFVWFTPINDDSSPSQQSGHITEVVLPKGSQKPTLRRHDLPPLPQEDREEPWQGALSGLLVPPAFVGGVIGYAALGNALGNATAEEMWRDLHKLPNIFLLLFALSAIGAILSAALALRVGTRCGFPTRTRWAWAMGVLLMGAFGLLMLLSLRGWPFRETCTTCGDSRAVTNELCEHCGSPFPSPPRDGTEIFEAVR